MRTREQESALEGLEKALREREQVYAVAVDRAEDAAEEDPDAYAAVRPMREALELVRCLRRLVPEVEARDIRGAFGAPGDWGYETAIGDALSRLYSAV